MVSQTNNTATEKAESFSLNFSPYTCEASQRQANSQEDD